MLSIACYNIYVHFDNKAFCHIVEIPMGMNCAPLIANLFSILLS